MKKISLDYSLEWVASVLAVVGILGVLQTFIIGKHFVIPTMILALTVFFGNLARSGFRDERWAKHLLFWFAFLITMHTFFALFWAKTPREMLGSAFVPVYALVCVVFAVLAWQYAVRNKLFDATM